MGAALPASALAKDWTESGTGSWVDSQNWSPSGAPSTGNDVTITQGTATLTGSEQGYYRRLNLGGVDGAAITFTEGGLLESALMEPTSVTVAGSTGHRGTITFASGEGVWNNAGLFTLGERGTGVLVMNQGAVMNNDQAMTLGRYAGGRGEATVHAGASLTIAGAYSIGWGGFGELTIAGNVSNHGATIGRSSTGVGVVTMTGGNWTNQSMITLGYDGQGTLNVSGGTISSIGVTDGFSAGDYLGSRGTVTFSGGTWNNRGNFVIGNLGQGDVTLSGGEIAVTANNGNSSTIIGRGREVEPGLAKGTLTVNGGTFRGGHMTIGQDGEGTLNLSSGEIHGTSVWIGDYHKGTAVVTGGTWTLTSELVVGEAGEGTLDLRNGTISSSGATIGSYSDAEGEVNVSGGLWTTSGLTVGRQGEGTLNLSGGTIRTNAHTGSAVSASGRGEIHLTGTSEGRGVLETDYISRGTGAATLHFNGGILRARKNEANLIRHYTSGSVTIGEEGARIDTQSYQVSLNTVLSGEGALIKQGSGSLTLGVANLHTGGAVVEGGTLLVTHAQGLGSGDAIVQTGGVLSIDAGAAVSNTVHLEGGTLSRAVAANQSFAGAFTVTAGEVAMTLLDGSSSAAAILSVTASDAPITLGQNTGMQASAVFDLTGVALADPESGATDLFVLQMTVDDLTADGFLAWYDSDRDEWVNAVEGNFGAPGQFFEDQSYNPLTDFQLGNYGYHLASNSVWAVLNHNSQFAVFDAEAIPEPGSAVLILIGAGLFWSRNRRQRRAA